MSIRRDERSKAEFRAMREGVGLSQADLAHDLGVNRSSVKRWERPDVDGYAPPDEAWQLLDTLVARQDAAVRAESESPTGLVTLPHYRSQEQYEARGHAGSFGIANATAWALAGTLRRRGVEVRFVEPGTERQR